MAAAKFSHPTGERFVNQNISPAPHWEQGFRASAAGNSKSLPFRFPPLFEKSIGVNGKSIGV